MKGIEIAGLDRSRLTLVGDGETTFVIARMPNDKAEGGSIVAIVALDPAGFAQLEQFVREVDE